MVGTPYSLSEARVLYELGRGETKAAALAERLDIDPGFLSRMLRRLGARAWRYRRRPPPTGASRSSS